MPTFFARSVSIHLSTTDLAKSTTTTPIARGCKEASEHLHRITEEFVIGAQEGTLSEIPVPENGTRSHIRFLGKDEDMPFFMVRAGEDFFSNANTTKRRALPSGKCDPHLIGVRGDSSTSEASLKGSVVFDNANEVDPEDEISLVVQPNHDLITENSKAAVAFIEEKSGRLKDERKTPIDARGGPSSSRQSLTANRGLMSRQRSIYQQPLKPQALCLTVSLSSSSFIQQPNSKSSKPMTLDIKIDIFFNGILCASTYVPERFRNSLNDCIELTQRFTGRRIAPTLERPWIIVPPGQRADGTLRDYKRSKGAYAAAAQRWSTIAESLREEAEKGGRDKYGELTLLGTYLESLSQMDKPTEVEGLQRAGGHKFGIIDVVLTAGKGQKDPAEAGAVSEPTSLRVSELKPKVKETNENNRRSIAQSRNSTSSTCKTFADDQIIAQGNIYHMPREARRSMAMADLDKSKKKINKITSTPFRTPKTPAKFLSVGTASRAKQSVESSGDNSALPSTSTSPVPSNYTAITPSDTSSVGQLRPRERRHIHNSSNSENGRSGGPDKSVLSSLQSETPLLEQVSVSSSKDFSKKIKTHTQQDSEGIQKVSLDTPLEPQSVPRKRYQGNDSGSEEQLKVKRARMNYHLVLTNRMTLAEEMASIEADSRQKFVTNTSFQPTRSSSSVNRRKYSKGSTTAVALVDQQSELGTPIMPENVALRDESSQQVDVGSDQQYCTKLEMDEHISLAPSRKSKIVILKLKYPFGGNQKESATPFHQRPDLQPEPALAPTRASYRASTSRTVSTDKEVAIPKISVLKPSNSLSSFATSSPLIPNHKEDSLGQPPSASKPLSHPRRRSKPHPSTPVPPRSLPIWPTPPSTEDCIISFAPDIVRQVRVERPGWFKESSVLMGVRFSIG